MIVPTTAERQAPSPTATAGNAFVLRRLLHDPQAVTGMLVIALIALAAIFAPLLAPYSPNLQLSDGLTAAGAPVGPGAKFILGADLLGRDLFSRLLYGGRASLAVGVIATVIAVAIGTTIGMAAGFLGGAVGSLLMRFTDMVATFPSLLLAILLAALFRPSLWIVVVVIALVNWVQVARVTYTATRSLAEREFVIAARSIGAGPLRILVRHVLPNLLSSVLIYGALGIATTVVFEATLSYIGVGVQPPTPSWGSMVNENQSYLTTAPWLVFFPGVAIIALALAFNLVGDALRDILDPRAKGRG